MGGPGLSQHRKFRRLVCVLGSEPLARLFGIYVGHLLRERG